jgi:hypothetical protein
MARLIYKYLDRSGVDVLRNLQLKVTPPNCFNDVFEFTPRPGRRRRPTINEALKVLCNRQRVQEIYESHCRSRELSFNMNEFNKWRRGYRDNPKAFRDYLTIPEGSFKSYCDGSVDNLSRAYGVVCFVTNRRNLLMWSHYADGHKGMVIGFRTDLLPRRRAVRYQARRVEYNLAQFITPRMDYAKCLVTTKGMMWKYERERRIIVKLDGLERRLLRDGTLGYFFDIPRESIAEVILGYRCTEDTSFAVKSALLVHAINIRAKCARPHSAKFDLEFGYSD